MESGDVERPAGKTPNVSAGSGSPVATLRVARLNDALLPNELARIGTGDLVAFLAPRRWFGAKAGRPTEARIRDAIQLPWESGRFAIARLEVTAASSEQKLYQLPLCVRSVDEIGDAP